MRDPDPIIVARDEVLAEVAIQIKHLTCAQRLTFFDLMEMAMRGMSTSVEIEMQQEEEHA